MPTRFSADADITAVLGRVGTRLPAQISVATFGDMAAARIEDLLLSAPGAPYPSGLPVFTGDGLQVLRWAEARLAAASILEILGETELPANLRQTAERDVTAGVPGSPAEPGSGTDLAETTLTDSMIPTHSSAAPVSNYNDPYAEIRDDPTYPLL